MVVVFGISVPCVVGYCIMDMRFVCLGWLLVVDKPPSSIDRPVALDKMYK